MRRLMPAPPNRNPHAVLRPSPQPKTAQILHTCNHNSRVNPAPSFCWLQPQQPGPCTTKKTFRSLRSTVAPGAADKNSTGLLGMAETGTPPPALLPTAPKSCSKVGTISCMLIRKSTNPGLRNESSLRRDETEILPLTTQALGRGQA